MEQTSRLRSHNPDILEFIASLSNDAIATPPKLANQMLDILEKGWAESHSEETIWSNQDITFLDPFCKSGIFLREVVKRLNVGLSKKIPDLNERVNHILTKQIYGIGITELNTLLAMRTVYCSRNIKSEHSIVDALVNPKGNLLHHRNYHSWIGGKKSFEVDELTGKEKVVYKGRKCKFCNGSEKEWDRDSTFESYAYSFLHNSDPQKFLKTLYGGNVKFDVVIGNPPFNLSDGGGTGTSAIPIYQHFVEQAKKLDPKYLCMIIPARWYSGGKGLDEFRESMLKDNRIRFIEDYPNSNDVFVGTQIKGGICYFLWDRDTPGDVTVTTHDKGDVISKATRPLVENGLDIFVRYNVAIPILKKIIKVEGSEKKGSLNLPPDKRFSELVSVRNPFKIAKEMREHKERRKKSLKLFRVGGPIYTDRSVVSKNEELIDRWKVFIPFLASGSDNYPHPILGKPFVGEPGSATTETNLVIGPFSSKKEAENVLSYIKTRLFRFLVLQKKPSQNATRKVYDFVPTQDFSNPWSDQKLYKRYGLNKNEINFIESMVRSMENLDDN
tara:strand:+ start:1355 stop:3022 length:1668 start_codon:yes stop_codon:yes gene_type:complete